MTDTDNRMDVDTDDTGDTDDDSVLEDAFELLAPTLADKLAGARKGLVAAVGVLLQGGAMAGLEGTALSWVQTTLAGLTAAAVYRVRNVEPAALWTAAEAPAASSRTDGEPTGAVDGYHPEHDQDDPERDHLPEHAAPDAPGPKHEAADGT